MLKTIVIVIASLLAVSFVATVISVNFNRHPNPPHGATRATIMVLQTALDLFHVDCQMYPDPETGLGALLVDPGVTNWHGPYIKHIPTDPWGNEIQYSLPDGKPHLRSAGPDMELETDDDITN
jgi:general secretion pathway protein G